VEGSGGLTFATSALADVITVVGPNIPPDDNRYGLNGVAVELSEGRARFVATDGNRLAWADAATEGAMDFPRQSLISRAGVAALANLLPGAGPRVTFATSGKYLEVRMDTGAMHAQFITAEFPDYRQVLPAVFPTTIMANRLDLLRAVDRVLPFAGGNIPEVLLTLPDGDNGETELTMTTRKLDSGDSLVTLAVVGSGPAIKLCLNGKYVRDVLITMECDEVLIAISGVLAPAIIVSKGSPPGPRAARLNVVMPVRIS
jgi:DNA polymerase-3 subunit beta